MTDDASADMEAEFQRASGEFLRRLDHVRQLEVDKRATSPGDPRRPDLASHIEILVRELLTHSQYQTRLTEAQQGMDPVTRPTHVILAEWRAAEREVEQAHTALREATGRSSVQQRQYQRSIEDRSRGE
jgi:hypothetical protein